MCLKKDHKHRIENNDIQRNMICTKVTLIYIYEKFLVRARGLETFVKSFFSRLNKFMGY